uniref:Neurotransmitter-gated ion-channel ligand-binding domain-containing protein n=1 Tax=Globodera rostochiensis TaxID=31243 RepID=A0A914GX95_GLORO
MPGCPKCNKFWLFLIAAICWVCLRIDAFGALRKKSQQRQQAARQLVVGSSISTNSRRPSGSTTTTTTTTDTAEEWEGQKWTTAEGEEEEEAEDDPNSRLTLRIRSKARPYRRPVKHSNDPIEVHVRSSLYQIVDLDQRNNLATLAAYFDVCWLDVFLPWNSSEFDGITTTFVPLRWVWRPEFYLYHSIQSRTPDFDSAAMVEVRSDGTVRLFVPITSRALCPINVKYFPYDTQNCTFLTQF